MLMNILCTVIFINFLVNILTTNGDKYNLKPEFNQCRSVFGFCQRPFAAIFNGGYFINSTKEHMKDNDNYYIDLHNSDETCHQGIFDFNISLSNHHNEKLLNASNNTMQYINKSWCNAYLDRHKVNCFGIPQCGNGKVCSYDYSCYTDEPNKITEYFEKLQYNLSFHGSLKFKNGAVRNLHCVVNGLPITNNFSYVHGINILVTPEFNMIHDDDFLTVDNKCLEGDLKFNPVSSKKTLYKEYKCVANAIIKNAPLKVGEIFQHTYSYDANGASNRRSKMLYYMISIILVMILTLV
jgi:hypothetical protein